MAKVKLLLFLSHNGVCSRRKAFDIIQKGSVQVNGQIVREPSLIIEDTKDYILVDGKRIVSKKFEYILLHKPSGYVTTFSDRFAERTVFDLLPKQYAHLAPVGRLDKDTEGLLLFTNDGELAYKMTHPKFNVYKTYFVRLEGVLDRKNKQKIESGVIVDGKKTAPAKVSNIVPHKNETELLLTIHEGRKRQVRLMFLQVRHKVIYLKRIAQGPIKLGNLKRGRYRLLMKNEWELLRK